MRNYVIINGTNSNTINGLGINELPPISKPPLRVQTEEIDGRDGDIITPLGYGAYNKTITIGLFGTGYDIDNIVSFFNGEGTIVFSNEPDKYYNYKIIEQIDYEALQKFKQASITFHCQPFKYPLSETPKEIEPNIKTLSNVESANITDSGISTIGIDLKGNTSQSGTPTPTSPIPVSVVSGDNDVVVSNANKLPYYQAATYSNNGVDYTSVGDGTYKLNNTATNTSYWEMVLDEAYTIQTGDYIQLNNDKVISNVQFVLRDTDNLQIAAFGCTEINKIYSLSSYIGKKIGVIRCYVVSGTSISNLTIQPMICSSSTQVDFVEHQSQVFEITLPILGKNLFNKDTAVRYKWLNSDGSYVNSADPNLVSDWIKVKPGTQYIFSGVATTTYSIRVCSYTSKNVATFVSNIINNDKTIRTFTANADYIRFAIGNSDTTSLNQIMLEEGTTASTYEAYNPLELCKIGDYQDYFTKNSGKNLFDKNNVVKVENKILNDSGVEVSDAGGAYTKMYMPVKPNTTYTTSGMPNGGTDRVYFFDNSKTFISRTSGYTNLSTFSFTTPANCYFIDIQYYMGNNNFNIWQIEKGSSATTYEPYGTGLWCKYNAIGKYTFTGSESWGKSGASTSSVFVGSTNITNAIDGNGLSNLFTYSSQVGVGYFTIYNSGANLRLCVDNNTISTIEAFKTWLSNNNTIVYYILNTPYLSLIEDTNLIEQLDNLENAMSYEGQTNISQVNNDKAFLMDVDYLEQGTDEITINNIGNTYAKPTIALEGNGVGNIYLNDTQIFRVELTDKMTISTSSMEAYDPDTSALLNRQVVGNYNSMTLQPGNNTIRIDGALDKATITNYVRWL